MLKIYLQLYCHCTLQKSKQGKPILHTARTKHMSK